MRPHSLSGIVAGLLFLVSCAHDPTKELVSARQVYARASTGPAARVAPAELHKAKVALTDAENEFERDHESQRGRDLAYVAERKAQLAEAVAVLQLDGETKKKAENEYQKQQTAQMQNTTRELQSTRAQLADAERARTQAAQETDKERQARLDAERRADEAGQKLTVAEQQAKDALSKLAEVKQEDRGLVITLSGSVLFATNKAALLPDAQTRLNQVAEALIPTKERNIIVEGYTDSRGSEEYNLELSRSRAMAVRDYLIGRGYPMEHIQAVGFGKSRPIADNTTADGRANNRRVEIVVQPRATALTQRSP